MPENAQTHGDNGTVYNHARQPKHRIVFFLKNIQSVGNRHRVDRDIGKVDQS